MRKYRAGVIGLGWMGMLADIAVVYERGTYSVDDVSARRLSLTFNASFTITRTWRREYTPHLG